MADEWIKMRIDLQSHPKVVRILSAMRPQDGRDLTDKFRVIGGLHAVWGVFDLHSEDGRLLGYTPDLMDHIIGWPGFSQAMIAVGWLRFDGSETLDMPEFSEHNGQSAKRRAEDQKRKRNHRAGVRKTSASDADKLRTESGLEIEKKEKEKKEQDQKKGRASAPVLPEWLPADAWADWHTFRNARKGWTPKARALSLRTLTELHAAGQDPRRVIEQSIERGWTGLFPLHDGASTKPPMAQQFADKTYTGTPDDELPDFLRADAR